MFRYISGANGNSGDDALLSEDGGINVRSLPEDVQAVFADIDANGDGVLDMEEFKTMLSTYAVLRRSNQEGSVSISTLPDKVQPALKVFDQDGDGTVDPKELMRAAEMYQASKKSQRRMRKFIIGLVLFVIALIGINSAMTFMMVELGKETKAAPDGIMRVNTNQPDHPGAVVRTAANGETSSITSALPDSAFAELKQFEVKSENGAFLSLMVLGWYRIPDALRARTGSFVKIVTYAGFITLDGDEMTFEETTGQVFSEAGFTVANGRKLLGIYELIGLFNSIDNWDGLDVASGEKKPSFGQNDFEMKYIERIPCDESKTCVNDIDDTWHKAAGPAGADAPEYIDIQHDILYDSHTHAASEVTYNAEYPDSIIHTYRSALRTVVEQVHKKTEDAFYCYEVDGKGEETTIWNVTEAVKVGESLTTDGTNRMIRHFTIETTITEEQHVALHLNDADEVEFTGVYKLEYYDDKANGHPYKFVMANREFIVTAFEEKEVDFPPPEDDVWDNDDSCTYGDEWEDFDLPVRVYRLNPFLLNFRDRAIARAEADGIEVWAGVTPPNATNATNSSGRRLLYSGPGVNCNPAGSCLGYNDLDTLEIEIGKFTMEINTWSLGCGLSDIKLSTQCPLGLTCYGTCSGTTPLLCKSDWDMYCGVGVEMDVKELVPAKLKGGMEKLGVEANMGTEFGYQASTKTVSIKVWAAMATGDLAKKRLSARRLLAQDDDMALSTFDAEFDLLEEGQLDLSEHLSDSHGRKLTWGRKKGKKKKKKKKKKGGFWSGVSKHVKKAVKSVAVAVTPKSGLSIEVSGTGSADLSKPKKPAFSLTAAVDAEVCIVGVCFSISETILKLPKK